MSIFIGDYDAEYYYDSANQEDMEIETELIPHACYAIMS